LALLCRNLILLRKSLRISHTSSFKLPFDFCASTKPRSKLRLGVRCGSFALTSLRREKEWFMLDFTFVLVTVAVFALAIFYVRGCALLK